MNSVSPASTEVKYKKSYFSGGSKMKNRFHVLYAGFSIITDIGT